MGDTVTDVASVRRRERLAGLVGEVLSPIVVVPALLVVVGALTAGRPLRGAVLGLVAGTFAVALPYGVLLALLRRGRLGDRHLSDRRERPAMLAITVVSVTGGLWLVHRLDAPAELMALVVAMVAGVVVSLIISVFWKVSIHTACVAGSVVSLAVLIHPAFLLGAPFVVLAGWSRTSVGAHTASQAFVGGVTGACVAGGVLQLALR